MALALLRGFNTDEILTWSPVRFAEETEHWESVEMILIEGASASDLAVTKRKLQESERAAIILGELCRRRLVRLLSFALQQSPGLVQAELPLNRSPLHEAACSGCPATVRCLISAGAAVNSADDHGMTPLHEAAAHSNDYAVRILLDAGAAFDTTDNGGRTVLHYASRSGSATCIQLLLAKGAAVDQVSADGCTALHEAATSPSAHAVRLLLDAGADKDAKSASGWTALHWAASRGRLYAVLILLEAGVSVDVKTLDEETPLHLAATLTSPDVWDALVAAGADEGAVDKNGQTPKERTAEKTVPLVDGCGNGGTNTSDVSPDQSHVHPGTANGTLLASNDNVDNSEDLSAENSPVLLSNVAPNSTTQETARTSQEDKGTVEEACVSSVSHQTVDKEGSSLNEASNNSVYVSEEITTENLTLRLSSVALSSTIQQTIAEFQENEGTDVDRISVVSGQRTDSVCSSLYEEYSELGDATESTDEMDSDEQTESGEETGSDDETASEEETGSGDETGSDTDIEDASSYISSANEEIDKFSERGSVNELCSPILPTSSLLNYEGPPLFQTLGTVGTSSKYNQEGTKFRGKFRGRGRGAPRGSRGNATAYTTRSVASVPRKKHATESSQSEESGQHYRSNGKVIRKGNFIRSVFQQARGQGDVSCGQLNTVLCRTESDQPHTKGQHSMRTDYRNRELHMAEGKKKEKTKRPKSVSQQQGDSNKEHKKKRRHDSRHGEGHHSNQHGASHHSKRHSEGHHSNQHGEGHYSNQHGQSYHSNQHGEGHHGNQHGEGHYGNQHGKGHRSNRSGENHRGNRHGEGYHNQHGERHRSNRHGAAHHGNQFGEGHQSNVYGEDHHGNGNYANQQGESRAGNRHGEARGGNWRGGGRGGNSHNKSRGGRN